jgi:hypothetical protein
MYVMLRPLRLLNKRKKERNLVLQSIREKGGEAWLWEGIGG